MKKIEIGLPDEALAQLEKLIAERGKNYVSVNTDEISGRDALLTDVFILGLDGLLAGENEFPDDVDEP